MRKLKSLFVVLAMVVLATVVNSADAKAAYVPNASMTTLTQTNATTSSITYSFTGSNATKYAIYTRPYADYSAEFTYLTTVTQAGTYTANNLQAGTAYYIKVVPYNAEGKEGYGRYVKMVTLISSMKNLHQEKWWKYALALDVQWDKLDAADGYDVVVKTAQGKKIKNTTASGAAYGFSLSNIKNEQIYNVSVRAKQNFNGQTIYTDWAKIDCFVQPTIVKANVKNGSMTINWKKIAGATGYTVYVSTNKKAKPSEYKKVASVNKKKSSCTIKKVGKSKIKAKKTYYVYVTTKYKKSASQPVYNYIIKGSSVRESYVY